MSKQVPSWLKGNLPTWLVVGMLTVNCWFIKRYVEQMDDNVRTLFTGMYDHEKRIIRMEAAPSGSRMMGMLSTETNTTKGN